MNILSILTFITLFLVDSNSAQAVTHCTKADVEKAVNDSCSALKLVREKPYLTRKNLVNSFENTGLFFKCNGGVAWVIHIGPPTEQYLQELLSLSAKLGQNTSQGQWLSGLHKSITNNANNPVFARACTHSNGKSWIAIATSKYKL